MFTVVQSIEIDRPVESVFAFLSKAENYPKWIDDLRTVRAPHGFLPGAVFEEEVVFQGKIKTSLGEVVQMEKDRLVVMRITKILSGPQLRPLRRLQLSAAPRGTTVTWTSEVEASGMMWWMQPLLPRMFRVKKAQFLAKLKAILES